MRAVSNVTPVYVISLLRHEQSRRPAIAGQLKALGLDFEFIDATDGKSLDLQEYAGRLNERRMLLHPHGKILLRSEIGCFLSHYQLWERMVAENISHAVIMEDDAILQDDFAEIVRELPLDGWRCDIVQLGFTSQPKGEIKFTLQEIGNRKNVVCFSKPLFETAAYFITLSAAKILLDYCRDMRAPIDNLYSEWWLNGLHFYYVYPAAATGNPLVEDSIQSDRIQNASKPLHRELYISLMWRIIKIFDRLRRYWWVMRFHPAKQSSSDLSDSP